MASITPSNLQVHSMGDTTLHIADINTASNGDIWSSGISNIIDIQTTPRGTYANGSDAGGAVSWTAASGVINFQSNAGGQRLSVWVVSGFGNK